MKKLLIILFILNNLSLSVLAQTNSNSENNKSNQNKLIVNQENISYSQGNNLDRRKSEENKLSERCQKIDPEKHHHIYHYLCERNK